MKFLTRLADTRDPKSLASRTRRRRGAFLRSLLAPMPKPVRIVDLGGTEAFWETVGAAGDAEIQVVLLNTSTQPTHYRNLTSRVGDATNLRHFSDNTFDVSFSNSVIEHLGTYRQQQLMATEHRRVASRYFVQTPNKYFPIEQHFLIPMFQFFPLSLQLQLIRRFSISWFDRIPDRAQAEAFLRSFRLLSYQDLRTLFPGAQIRTERYCGLAKSFMVVGGWETQG
ncbi:MAG TPA: class I SAM-dependent methyltransferase [Acidobacteriota bacterium]|nr:class I SAM-dependent methyltransferase [Acidobacteriota bacterium]